MRALARAKERWKAAAPFVWETRQKDRAPTGRMVSESVDLGVGYESERSYV